MAKKRKLRSSKPETTVSELAVTAEANGGGENNNNEEEEEYDICLL